MSMGPRTPAQHAVLSASATRPDSSFGSHKDDVDLTKGVSFHMMSPTAEALIQQAIGRVGTSKHLHSGPNQAVDTVIWTPSQSKGSSSGKVPGFHAKKVGWDKLNIGHPPISPSFKKQLPTLQGHALLHSSPRSSPGKMF
jgi:hypothetical protein